MVAYEDLVVALTNWRITQGLPTGADAFAAFETGSVDLALPVADPVELSTSEVLEVDSDEGIEAIADDSEGFEVLDAQSDESDVDEFESAAEDETAFASRDETEEPMVEAESDDSLEDNVDQDLDFADDETAYGDMPNMDGVDTMSAAELGDENPLDSAHIDDPQTEEVDVLAAEEEIDQAEDYASSGMAVEEEIDADGLEVEAVDADNFDVEEEVDAEGLDMEAVDADDLPVEEVNADDFEAVEVAGDDEFSSDEVPTKFGEQDDRESTVMGMGIDELVPPDKG